jgi:hypothetical protein
MKRTLQVLNELERDGVVECYAIGGAMAATFYVEPLLTFDLDVFVILPQDAGNLLSLAPLYGELRSRGYVEEGECVLIEGVPVQFVPAYNALLEEALREARETLYEEVSARVVRAEHLIAICLQTGPRQGPRTRAYSSRAGGTRYELSGRRAPTSRSGREVEAMDTLKPEIAKLFVAKEARRRKLARLSFPEKVRAVVQLQQMAAPVLRARGRMVRVWTLDDGIP